MGLLYCFLSFADPLNLCQTHDGHGTRNTEAEVENLRKENVQRNYRRERTKRRRKRKTETEDGFVTRRRNKEAEHGGGEGGVCH